MLFRSSPFLLLLLLRVMALAQTPEAPEKIVGSVNGVEITERQIDETVAAAIYPLQQQLYAIRKSALENLIVSRVLESEARSQRVSVEEVRRRLTAGNSQVTTAQVEEAYKQNASFFASMSPDEARERLRLDLENQLRMKHYRAGIEQLRKKWLATASLDPPAAAPELDDGSSPAKGPPKPLVTMVEFSDFECPFCRQVQEVLKQIAERYGEDVRFVFRHLPLEGHPNSLTAARAAYCAGEQDRFWQFHDALFATERDLSLPELGKIANELGLGRAKFDACVSDERSRTAVVKDLETARRFGVDSTPSFFINGKLVKGALAFPEFQAIIERELQGRLTRKASSTK